MAAFPCGSVSAIRKNTKWWKSAPNGAELNSPKNEWIFNDCQYAGNSRYSVSHFSAWQIGLFSASLKSHAQNAIFLVIAVKNSRMPDRQRKKTRYFECVARTGVAPQWIGNTYSNLLPIKSIIWYTRTHGSECLKCWTLLLFVCNWILIK